MPEAPLDTSFPTFVGHRRRLLFEDDDLEHEAAGRAASHAAAEQQLSRETALESVSHLAHLAHEHECGTCHAAFPSPRLLGIHLSEVHDSFFAAQAARRLPVYLCLVEACPRKFCTVEERKQHLVDHHRFPKNYNFDRQHLRRRQGQVRAMPEYQKASHAGRQGVAATDAMEFAVPGHSSGGGAAAGVADEAGAAVAAAAESHGDDLAQGFSRLRVAASQSQVPATVSFGRQAPGLELPRPNRTRAEGESAAKRANKGEAQTDDMQYT